MYQPASYLIRFSSSRHCWKHLLLRDTLVLNITHETTEWQMFIVHQRWHCALGQEPLSQHFGQLWTPAISPFLVSFTKPKHFHLVRNKLFPTMCLVWKSEEQQRFSGCSKSSTSGGRSLYAHAMAWPSLWHVRGRPGNALDNAGLPRCTHLDNNSASRLLWRDQLWQTTFASDLAVWRPHGVPTRSSVTTLLLWVHTVEDDLQENVSFSQSAAVWPCQQAQFDSKCFPLSNRLSIVLFTDGGSMTSERRTFSGLGRRTIGLWNWWNRLFLASKMLPLKTFSVLHAPQTPTCKAPSFAAGYAPE